MAVMIQGQEHRRFAVVGGYFFSIFSSQLNWRNPLLLQEKASNQTLVFYPPNSENEHFS